MLSLTQAPQLLKSKHSVAVKYRTLYNLATDGAIPVTRATNGRWVFDPKDLPAIARALTAQAEG